MVMGNRFEKVARARWRKKKRKRKKRGARPADNGSRENVTLGRASLTEGYAFAFIYTWRVHVFVHVHLTNSAHATLSSRTKYARHPHSFELNEQFRL